ncbi:MAG: hypothetical protein ACP5KY_05770 [Thermoproteus sp.]
MDSGDLLRFYRSLETSLRLLISFKFRYTVGKTFEEVAEHEPWRLYYALIEAVGEHNAELFLNMLREWLMRKGEVVDLRALRAMLSDEKAWAKRARA